MKKSKTGIIGGTFNPIHNGHIRLAECALEQFCLDSVIFIPDNVAYHKHENDMASADQRFTMTELAVSDHPFFSVSDMDIKRPGNTYTCDTLSRLRNLMPDTEFYFIIGADSLFTFETWKEPALISERCVILAAARGESEKISMQNKCIYLKERFGSDIRLIDFERIDISSTSVRDHIRSGDIEWCRSRVPSKVLEYIINNSVYPVL